MSDSPATVRIPAESVVLEGLLGMSSGAAGIEERGTLEEVVRLATDWFRDHFRGGSRRSH
jgi:hypothetical protein